MASDSKYSPIFGTNGIRGVPNADLTTEFAMEIGKAAGTYFGQGPVAMARDTRDTGSMIFNAVSSGIMSTGVDVVDAGVLPTPALQLYCKTNDIPGVVITASHNPPRFNGIKCIASDGTELRRDDEEKIEKIYYDKAYRIAPWDGSGKLRLETGVQELYVSTILSRVDQKLVRSKRFRVLVDTGNGASFSTTPSLLRRLGCSVVSLNAYPDGMFTSRQSEPKPENLKDLISLMKNGGFDLGVAHDGDADRAVFIDENGNFIDGDMTLTLIVKSVIRPGDTVVTPISSSDAITEICETGKATLIRTRVGAPLVSRTMIDNQARVGGEENGGIIFGAHQYCRDGAMTVALVLDLMAHENRKISKLVSELPEYHIHKLSVERRKDWKKLEESLLQYSNADAVDRSDGLKLYFEDGWVLMRPSGTEPIIRVYGESSDPKRARELAAEYEALLIGLQEEPRAP